MIKFGDREYVVSSRIEARDDFCDCYMETTDEEENSEGKLAQLGLVAKKLTVQSSRDDSQKKLRKGKEEVEGTKSARKYVRMLHPQHTCRDVIRLNACGLCCDTKKIE